jgi:hypothetical protein
MADEAKVAPTKIGKRNPKQLANLRPPFEKGNKLSPGRPKGSRNKLGEAFFEDMLAAWQTQGKKAIDRVIEERPHEFIKAVASILPKDVTIRTEAVQELSDDELATALAALRAVGALAGAREGDEAPSRH